MSTTSLVKRTFRAVVLTKTVLILAICIAGYLAAYIRPGDYWIGALLAVGLPFAGLMLVPFLVLHLAARRWLWAGLCLGMIILVANRHWSFERFSRPEAERGDLTLMTFNVPRRPDDAASAKKVDAIVKGIKPDLIGLQESVIWAAKREPTKLLAHAKFRTTIDSLGYRTLPPRDGPPDVSWVRWSQPLLSLHPIVKQDQIVLERDIPGWPELEVLRTELKLDGRSLAHYNIHLFTYGPSKPWSRGGDWLSLDRWTTFLEEAKTSFRVRSWQADQIRKLLDKESLPIILSGDFNGTADNWSYHRISDGLQDAFRVAGDGWGATYHSQFPFLRIDFVLLDQSFEVVRGTVPSTYETSSDHRPLVVRFRWRDQD